MKDQPRSYIPNAMATLRLVLVWIDKRSGNVKSFDGAIVGWIIDPKLTMPAPVGLSVIKDAEPFVFDQTTKCWTGAQGDVYSEWRDLVAPIYLEWERTHPKPKAEGLAGAMDWPLDQRHPTPMPQPITTPGIGAPSDGPKPWK